MGQVTIYLDDQNERRLRNAAEAAGMPVSRWVASLIEQSGRTEWPESLQRLAGSWGDFPEPEELRATAAAEIPREPL
jgi:hypothetical protein